MTACCSVVRLQPGSDRTSCYTAPSASRPGRICRCPHHRESGRTLSAVLSGPRYFPLPVAGFAPVVFPESLLVMPMLFRNSLTLSVFILPPLLSCSRQTCSRMFSAALMLPLLDCAIKSRCLASGSMPMVWQILSSLAFICSGSVW